MDHNICDDIEAEVRSLGVLYDPASAILPQFVGMSAREIGEALHESSFTQNIGLSSALTGPKGPLHGRSSTP